MSDKVFYSECRDPIQSWDSWGDFFHVVLLPIPNRWWSLRDWRLAMGVRKFLRWQMSTPPITNVKEYCERLTR